MRAVALVSLVAFLATGVLYAGIVDHEPLRWDDSVNLVENPHIRSFSGENLAWMLTTTHLGPWQPLSWLTLTADHVLWDGDPAGHYVGNLLLHALAAALLALVAARLFSRAIPGLAGRPRVVAAAALAAALLWSCHPLRVESVAWATERRDVLSGALLLGAVLAWLRHATAKGGRRGAYVASILLFAASLAAKATAMGLVFVLVLLDAWPLGRPVRKHLPEKVPFLLLGIGAAVVAWLGQAGTEAVVGLETVSLPGRIVLAGHAAAFHVLKTLFPVGLRAHYARPVPFDPGATWLVLGTAFTVLLCAVSFVLRRPLPALGTAFFSFLFLLAPVSGLAITGSHLVADRYSYLSAIPLTLLAAGAVAGVVARRAREGRVLLAGSPLLVLPFLVVGSLSLIRTWEDDESLWMRTLALEPGNWVAHEQLAHVAVERGDRPRAMAHLSVSLEGMPGRAKALALLSYLELESGRAEEALRHARGAVGADPERAAGWRVLGLALAAAGDGSGAESAFRRSLALDPDSVEARGDYAEFLFLAGRFPEAEEQARAALELDPGRTAVRVMLGAILAQQGDLDEARAELNRALAAEPDHPLGLLWRGRVAVASGNPDVAEDAFRGLLVLEPGHPEAMGSLAQILARRGAFEESATWLRHVRDRDPGQPWNHLRLGVVLARAGRVEAGRAEIRAAIRLARDSGDERCVEAARGALEELD